MRNKEVAEWRLRLIFIALIGMLIGVFAGRAILSVFMMVFFAAATFHQNFFQQVKRNLQSPLLLSISFLFFIPFISGLWSSNKMEWLDVLRTKLPLLVMPLAFAGTWQLTRKNWTIIFYIFLLLVLSGCCWSLWQYANDAAVINESYLKAKSIPTPFENDHVRFSWIVAIAGAGCLLCLSSLANNKHRVAAILLVAFFVAYLHLLSARTGLFCFYFFAIAYLIQQVMQSTNRKKLIPAILFCLLPPVLAWLLLPTLQNRIRYMVYDFSFIKQSTYLPGGNDGNRMLSIKAGWNIISSNFFGVGAGDVRDATNAWYASNVSGMLPADHLLPSSEWLVYGAFAGWVGIIGFSVIMLTPFAVTFKKHRFAWMAVNAMAALSFLFDIGLEVQFGVFLYTFIILSCYKWLCAEQPASLHE